MVSHNAMNSKRATFLLRTGFTKTKENGEVFFAVNQPHLLEQEIHVCASHMETPPLFAFRHAQRQ